MPALLAAEAAGPSFLAPGIVMALMFVAFVVFNVRIVGRLRRNGFRSGASTPFRRVSHEFGSDARTWKGGARHGRLSVSMPLASLTADAEFVLVKVVSTPVWIRRDEVTMVRSWPYQLGHAVMFDTAGGLFDGLAFFTMSADLCRGLAAMGWPATPEPLLPPLPPPGIT